MKKRHAVLYWLKDQKGSGIWKVFPSQVDARKFFDGLSVHYGDLLKYRCITPWSPDNCSESGKL